MVKIIIGILLAALLAVAAWFLLMQRGPDLSKYEGLRQPRIEPMADQRMLVVRATGDPNTAGMKAFGTLFKAFFALKRKAKGVAMAAPRARWPLPLDTPKDQWVGIYGMPVPNDIQLLPQGVAGAELETWQYGTVAQILHVGPYSAEPPTIQRLLKFIEDGGYQVAGPHEEEYLRGPSMFGKGNPDKYYTIIRYAVTAKADTAAKPPAKPKGK